MFDDDDTKQLAGQVGVGQTLRCGPKRSPVRSEARQAQRARQVAPREKGRRDIATVPGRGYVKFLETLVKMLGTFGVEDSI
jgi:hypothetical protein